MKTRYKLALCFGKIEGQSSGFGDSGNKKQNKAEKLRNDEPKPPLGFYDVCNTE
jgi:hypothetical protein